MVTKEQDQQGTSTQMTQKAARNFDNFVDYLRRDPAKKLPRRPPGPPKFRNTTEFLGYETRLFMKSKLVSDQCKYITGNFEEKRKAIGAKIDQILRNLWKEVPPPHLRLEFANVLNFTITYAEFWNWIGETINRDYALGMKSFLPCDLIQKFADFFSTIESCQRNTHVDPTHFSQLLKLRDAVIACIQNHYRVAWPILKTKQYTTHFPNHTEDQRYSPYDTEWLCGSVISGPNYLSCVKYLCITRLAQLDIACMRADIIAEKEKLDIDFIESIRVPLPVDATNPKMLGNALYNREIRMKENFRKTKQVLVEKLENNIDLRFVVTTTEFIELRGDIRRKKKNVMDLLVQCDRNDFRPFLQIIAVMTTVEAELLILLRIAAQFIDKKLGMYGRPLPNTVYKYAIRLFLTTTLESCREYPLSGEITELLDRLRDEVRKYARDWYINHEKNCELVYTEKIDVENMEQKYMMCYELSTIDFTDEFEIYMDRMLKYLRLEQIEMERLLCQLCQVKRARWYWPKRDVPEFSLNVCKGLVSAFCTNFDQGMPASEVETIQRHAEFVLQESTMTTSIGEEILLSAQVVMKDMRCVPDCSHITSAFHTHFAANLGEERVENKTAQELAIQFSEIIIADIEMSNHRANIHRAGGNPVHCAQKIATDVLLKYLQYVENPMPSMRIAIPMDPPPGEDDSDESASDEESDYATDEGEEVAPGIVVSSDEESDDGDEDESHSDMESANGSNGDSDDDETERSEDDEDEQSDDSETSEDRNHTAFLASALLNAFSLDREVANRAFIEVASTALFTQDPSAYLSQYEVVPDELINAFLACFIGVNRNIVPELQDVD